MEFIYIVTGLDAVFIYVEAHRNIVLSQQYAARSN